MQFWRNYGMIVQISKTGESSMLNRKVVSGLTLFIISHLCLGLLIQVAKSHQAQQEAKVIDYI